MKSIYKTIIKPKGERYNNTDTIGGKSLIVNSSINEKDFEHTNRIGTVLETSLYNTFLEKGDDVIVHHNVFRKYWGFSTHLRTSSNDLNNGTFGVYDDQMFAYKRNGKWTCLEDWIFVKPVKTNTEGFIWTLNEFEPLTGEIHLSSAEGFKIGERVLFTPNSEYIFRIEGEFVYKMRTRDITAKII